MASGAVSRKATSHSYSSTSASNLDNNLDALLDDLQTSINAPSRNASSPHHNSSSTSSSRIIETTTRRSPLRSVSPSGARTTTLEKYVSTGPAGTPSGIPGLEMLEAELQDVQPGQSKTVAYKQVSYHYDKKQEGKDLEPWIKTDKFTKNDASIVDNFCERTFEKSDSSMKTSRDNYSERTFEKSDSSFRTARDSPDFAKSGKEIIYKADVSTKTIPTIIPTTTESRSTEKDFKYIKETSKIIPTTTESRSTEKDFKYVKETSKIIPTTTESRSTEKDFKYVKETSYHTEPSPVSSRKNIKTVRTDETEELTNVEYIPAAAQIPANLAPGPNTKVTTTIKTYTYELPGAPETYIPSASSTLTKNVNVDKSISYSLPREQEKTVTYHVEEQKSGSREYVPAPSPTTSSRIHREEKVYMERRGYRGASPSPPVATTTSSSSSLSRNERYHQQHQQHQHQQQQQHHQQSLNRVPSPEQSHSRTERTERIIYQNEPAPAPVVEGTRTTYKQYEEHYSGNRPSKTNYYPTENSHHSSSSTHIYKHYDEQHSLLPKPFPTSERPASPRQQPPKRIEDLMASFSDSEEVVEVMHKRDRKDNKRDVKKEVDFVPQSQPAIKSKNVAGPPVYYPPGSGEFSKKEEAQGSSSKSGGGWAKERAGYEYGASGKNDEKVKTKKSVVPVCLPLCCALPCVIM